MSKTFQEIEISNGSWINKQSDQINISNENKLIEFSENTFRLLDAMIFISYNASPLMHALNFIKQFLDFKEYWEKSIDYIIADINLKEFNNKSKEGIETFVLFWNIISNKNFQEDEVKTSLVNKVIETIYNNEFVSNAEFLNDINVLSILGINCMDLLDTQFEVRKIENIISKEIQKINSISLHYINILNKNLIEETKINNNWIVYSFNTKRFCLSQSKYRFKTILKQVYKDWFKRELRNWLKANLVIIKKFNVSYNFQNIKILGMKFNLIEHSKISDNMIEHILGNIEKFLHSDYGHNNIYYYFRYEFGYFTKNLDNCSKIKFNYNSLYNKYKIYFNENIDLYDYFILQNKNNRYGIKYE